MKQEKKKENRVKKIKKRRRKKEEEILRPCLVSTKIFSSIPSNLWTHAWNIKCR